MAKLLSELKPDDGIIYLAGPYTAPAKETRLERFNDATKAAAHLIEKGFFVYSPLTMTHPIDIVLSEEGETKGSDYWVAFDEAFMVHCASIVVLMSDGWKDSRGIAREIEFFTRSSKPVVYAKPSELGLG